MRGDLIALFGNRRRFLLPRRGLVGRTAQGALHDQVFARLRALVDAAAKFGDSRRGPFDGGAHPSFEG